MSAECSLRSCLTHGGCAGLGGQGRAKERRACWRHPSRRQALSRALLALQDHVTPVDAMGREIYQEGGAVALRQSSRYSTRGVALMPWGGVRGQGNAWGPAHKQDPRRVRRSVVRFLEHFHGPFGCYAVSPPSCVKRGMIWGGGGGGGGSLAKGAPSNAWDPRTNRTMSFRASPPIGRSISGAFPRAIRVLRGVPPLVCKKGYDLGGGGGGGGQSGQGGSKQRVGSAHK